MIRRQLFFEERTRAAMQRKSLLLSAHFECRAAQQVQRLALLEFHDDKTL